MRCRCCGAEEHDLEITRIALSREEVSERRLRDREVAARAVAQRHATALFTDRTPLEPTGPGLALGDQSEASCIAAHAVDLAGVHAAAAIALGVGDSVERHAMGRVRKPAVGARDGAVGDRSFTLWALHQHCVRA